MDEKISVKEKYTRTEYIELWIEDGIFHGKYAEGVIVDNAVAEGVWKHREEMCENIPYLTFWDCRGVKYWTRDAREMQSSDRNYRLMKAGAVLYKETHVANVVINFFMKVSPPPIPTKFFSSKKAALNWLKNLNLE